MINLESEMWSNRTSFKCVKLSNSVQMWWQKVWNSNLLHSEGVFAVLIRFECNTYDMSFCSGKILVLIHQKSETLFTNRFCFSWMFHYAKSYDKKVDCCFQSKFVWTASSVPDEFERDFCDCLNSVFINT